MQTGGGPPLPPAQREVGGDGLAYIVTSTNKLLLPSEDNGLRRMRRMKTGILSTAKACQEYMTGRRHRFQAWFGMLTYRPGEGYSPRDVSKFIDHLSKWSKRRGIIARGLWVLELQGNGQPHYHYMLWLPRGITPPKPDKQGWWPKGFSSRYRARSPVGYIAKYSSKLRSKGGQAISLPPGARVWGSFGMPAKVRDMVSWWQCPRWLKDFVAVGHRVVKQGGWWLDTVNRIRYRSPWVVDSFRADGIVLRWVGWTADDVEFV